MRQYEVIAIFTPQYVGEKLEELKRSFSDQVQKQGGKILGTREMGKRAFGYTVKKQREGNYFVYDFELNPAKISDLKKTLSLAEGILRYTIFVKEKVTVPPTPQPAQKALKPTVPTRA